MSRSKKIFLLIAAIFLLIVLYIGYDIATRTTFPRTEVPRTEVPRVDTPRTDVPRGGPTQMEVPDSNSEPNLKERTAPSEL